MLSIHVGAPPTVRLANSTLTLNRLYECVGKWLMQLNGNAICKKNCKYFTIACVSFKDINVFHIE